MKTSRAVRRTVLYSLSLLLAGGTTQAADWLRAGLNTNQPLWGVGGGLLCAAPPGGVAFENFELRERFYEGQVFVFGITRKTPAQLWAASDRRSPPSQTNQIELTAGSFLPFASGSARLPSKPL